jgi:putative drug exporter of the RND superfamily
VPAALAMLGERAWYLPRWLAWLPFGRTGVRAGDQDGNLPGAVPEPVPSGGDDARRPAGALDRN